MKNCCWFIPFRSLVVFSMFLNCVTFQYICYYIYSFKSLKPTCFFFKPVYLFLFVFLFLFVWLLHGYVVTSFPNITILFNLIFQCFPLSLSHSIDLYFLAIASFSSRICSKTFSRDIFISVDQIWFSIRFRCGARTLTKYLRIPFFLIQIYSDCESKKNWGKPDTPHVSSNKTYTRHEIV